MNIEMILAEPQKWLGQSLELEGYFIGLREGTDYVAYLGSSADVPAAEKQQIRIAHSFAELKTMIRPLLSMQLLYRGVLTNPPYYYRFPIRLKARVDMNGSDKPVLHEITALSLQAPYSGKLGELVPYSNYEYQATIEHLPQRNPETGQTSKARVTSIRQLLLKENTQAISLSPDENRYARWSLGQVIKIPGWLKYLAGTKNGESQFVLQTYAIRSAMVAVGPLKEMCSIWLRPSALYALLRAHMPISTEHDLHQRVEITGKIDYLQDEIPPIESEILPKLVFTDIQAVSIYEENYLFEN